MASSNALILTKRMADSAFTLNGQVGFVAFMRSGGRLIDAGGAVRFYTNSAT